MTLDIKKIKKSRISNYDLSTLTFGEIFTDHMFECDYENGKWQTPIIRPYEPLSIDPSAKILHYGQSVFEGMKAYKDDDDSIWLFRPELNQIRINVSANRLDMPSFPKEYFFEGLNTLLKMDSEWILKGVKNSLYIRPIMFATEQCVSASTSDKYKFMIICSPVQGYYQVDVNVVFEEKYSRAANGGVGFAKAAGNYAASFLPAKLANEKGFNQIVWTDASSHKYLEEAGTMNIFFRVNDKLLTAPISDRILDGVTRKSVIELAKSEGIIVEERRIEVSEIIEAAKNDELLEMFGTGTAVVVNPISSFSNKGEFYKLPEVEHSYAKFLKSKIKDIQRNVSEDKFGWTYKVK